MKKRTSVITSFVLAMVLAFTALIVFAEEDTTYINSTIQTPTGMIVNVEILDVEDIEGTTVADILHEQIDGIFSDNVIKLSDASMRYDSHSYAWYSQDYENNPYCIPDPSAYFDCDLATQEAYEESNGSIGDIIVYFNSSDVPIFSGIVVNTLSGTSNGICGNADLKMVQSKWNAYGLYTHRGDRFIFSPTYATYEDACAEYVRYYKLKNHEHNWNLQLNTSNWDEIYCSTCSLTMYHNLSYSDNQDGETHNLNCSFCGTLKKFVHECDNFVNSEDELHHEGVCSVCNGQFYELHTCTTFTNSNISGYHQGVCTECNTTVYDLHQWVMISNGRYRCTICNYTTRNISLLKTEEEEVNLK